jgi:hypothetical protein
MKELLPSAMNFFIADNYEDELDALLVTGDW